jgi:hypothetical protein
MSFTAYIERQKSLIRHHSEYFTERNLLLERDDGKYEERFFKELESLKGLNKEERKRFMEVG